MPLVSRLSSIDTIRGFRAASTQRFREAHALATCDQRLGSLYLLGYCAEMLIKAAYFRHTGKAPVDPIGRLDFDGARTQASHLGVAKGRNLHDVRWWTELLLQSRRSSGDPHPLHFAVQLAKFARAVDQNWRETLRYRTNRPSRKELEAATEAVQWLIRNYRML